MLVRAHAVEAVLRGVLELVERPVVVLAHAARIGKLPPGWRHPDRFVTLLEVGGQLAIRHQMEGADLHGPLTLPGSAAGWRSRPARARPGTRSGSACDPRDRGRSPAARSAGRCGCGRPETPSTAGRRAWPPRRRTAPSPRAPAGR